MAERSRPSRLRMAGGKERSAAARGGHIGVLALCGPLLAAAPASAAQPDVASPSAPGVVNAALPEGGWELRLSPGLEWTTRQNHFPTLLGALNWAITGRLSWSLPLPAFSYRWGESGRAELIARAGLTGFGYDGEVEALIGFTDATVMAQLWLHRQLSISAQAGAEWDFQTHRPSG